MCDISITTYSSVVCTTTSIFHQNDKINVQNRNWNNTITSSILQPKLVKMDAGLFELWILCFSRSNADFLKVNKKTRRIETVWKLVQALKRTIIGEKSQLNWSNTSSSSTLS